MNPCLNRNYGAAEEHDGGEGYGLGLNKMRGIFCNEGRIFVYQVNDIVRSVSRFAEYFSPFMNVAF